MDRKQMEFRDLKRQYGKLKVSIDRMMQEVVLQTHFNSGAQVRELEETLAAYVGVNIAFPVPVERMRLRLCCFHMTSGQGMLFLSQILRSFLWGNVPRLSGLRQFLLMFNRILSIYLRQHWKKL